MLNVRCDSCGALNRVSSDRPTGAPVCGRCKSPLSVDAVLPNPFLSPRLKTSLGVVGLIATGVVASELVRSFGNAPPVLPATVSERPVPSGVSSPSQGATRPIPVTAPAVPSGFEAMMPKPFVQGVVWISPAGERIAPFNVITSPGQNYYVKLMSGKSDYARFRVEGGKPFSTNVAPGRYTMRYLTGASWYGPKPLYFGPETVFRRADKAMDFQVYGDRVEGVTVELILQLDGNLRTQNIDRAEFDPD